MLSCLLTAFHQLALFLFYFLYFLFKGHPEWQKIGTDERCSTKNCCLHNPKMHSEVSSSASGKYAQTYNKNSETIKTEVSWIGGERTTKMSLFQRMNSSRELCKQHADKAVQTLQWAGRVLCGVLKFIVSYISDTAVWLYSTTYEWVIDRGTASNSNSLSKSNQFTQKTNTETIAEVKLSPQDQQQQFGSVDPFTESTASYQDAGANFPKILLVKESDAELGEFYVGKLPYNKDPENFNQKNVNANDVTTIAPPSPLPPTFTTVTSTIVTQDAEVTAEKVASCFDDANDRVGENKASRLTKAPPKGGVAVLPPDIMAEAHARVKQRDQKFIEGENISTDWTVTNKRFIPAEWTKSAPKVDLSEPESKASEDESETWRPESRTVVSRILKSSDQDAQFIFRPPKHETVPPNCLPEGSFLMGRSVFSPVQEAEEMRNRVNQQLIETPSEIWLDFSNDSYTASSDAVTYNSHPDRYSSCPTSRSRSQSRIHPVVSPVAVNHIQFQRENEHRTGMLRQRSRTVEPRAEGTVKALTRQWPPQSNATGVHSAKDSWNIIPSEIVSSRRVMERSVTDKWTTRNQKGEILDEWSTRSWKGETDGLRRCGDSRGEAWHREVEVSPQGKTSFVDNRRFYTRDYVIESEIRNA